MFALVDCNNFYASCERVFEPRLIGRPIVVLSNNDGCVIARSQEAKAMGIAMGEPFFKVKPLIREGLIVRSSNYALYGDMSQRVMSVLSDFAPRQEIYSIDESFLDLSDIAQKQLPDLARRMRAQVLQWTGIPVGIGIGTTKTLAKLANRVAKKTPRCQGTEVLNTPASLHYALATCPVGEIWGVGRRWGARLRAEGVHSALDFRDMPDRWLRQRLGVVGLRTAFELRGIQAMEIEDLKHPRQTICVSRSFGTPLFEKHDLEDAIRTFTARAGEKMRTQDLITPALCLFMRTNPFRNDLPQYQASTCRAIAPPSDDTRLLLKAALDGFRAIYRPGYLYKKAGVLLLDLSEKGTGTPSLFESPPAQSAPLMSALDRLNRRFGAQSITIGHTRKTRSWYATRDYASPRYTTCWSELPTVR